MSRSGTYSPSGTKWNLSAVATIRACGSITASEFQ